MEVPGGERSECTKHSAPVGAEQSKLTEEQSVLRGTGKGSRT
ncbi:hypothetical protein LEMLEM_LOCUS11701 [Lemmus lemmus]